MKRPGARALGVGVAVVNLACALIAAGDRAAAAAALETALRLDPNLAGARAMLDELRPAAH